MFSLFKCKKELIVFLDAFWGISFDTTINAINDFSQSNKISGIYFEKIQATLSRNLNNTLSTRRHPVFSGGGG